MEKEEVERYIKKLPSNIDIATEVLSILDNNKTKVILSENIKGNYYSFINDTMYISKISENTNGYNRAVVICHECRHSIQNKKVQLMNTILSNLTLISYVVFLILVILSKMSWTILPICITLICVIIREYLELDATKNSVEIYRKYVDGKFEKSIADSTYIYFKKEIRVAKVLYVFKIILDKFLPILVILIINLIKNHIFN